MMSSMFTGGPRIARRDVVVAVLFAVLGVAFIAWAQGRHDGPGSVPGKLLMGLLILPATVPVLWRRRAPLVAVGGTLIGTAVHVAVYGMITRCGLMLPLFFVEAFAVAAWQERREAWVGLVVVLAAGVVLLSQDASAGWGGLEVSVPVTLAVWCIGRVVRSRAGMVARLRERNAELGAQREANARLEVESDRVRLSAELDELLRTRLADLTQLAEAGAREHDAGPAFERIETGSRATLEQMRAVVGLLRNGDGTLTDPQPTLDHLGALLLSAKGNRAQLTVTGEPRLLPAGLELSAYRVVEHLLSATDDQPDVKIHVDFGADTLALTVSGPIRGNRRRTEAGFGRARERLALHDGSLEVEIAAGHACATAALPVLVAA